MSEVSVQGDLFGGETITADPRVERAARALWDRDARRSVGGGQVAPLWPRVRKDYLETARVALTAADAA